MRDKITINAPNSSGNASGKNAGKMKSETQNDNITLRSQNLIKLRERYECNTDRKVAAYFSWVRHILTVDAGLIVLICALAQNFLVANITCSIFMIATVVCLLLSLFFGIFCLIGETQFHDSKCIANVHSISNQQRDKKAMVFESNHINVRPIYAVFANKTLLCFSLALLSISLYVVGYVFFSLLYRFSLWGIDCDMALCLLFVLVFYGVLHYLSGKIEEIGFDWEQLGKTLERISITDN